MINEIEAIGVTDYDHWLEPEKFTYKPRELKPTDVDIEIIACGICGSDIHAANGDWGRPYVPIAVGHEIIGKVVALGEKVEKFKIGDRVGIGAQCDSCGECTRCEHHHENACRKMIGTYGAVQDGFPMQGGYAKYKRCNERFVFRIPDGIDTKHAAPLLCGGITGFRPLMTAGVKEGTKVGVVGIGGIGHMTILFAKALGAEVTAISRSYTKKDTALKLGADHYVATSDEDKFPKDYEDSLDVIVNTTSTFGKQSIADLMFMLKPFGEFRFITAPPLDEKLVLEPFNLLMGNLSVHGSGIGSPQDIEYMLDLAEKKQIKPWVEEIDISEENVATAWKRMNSGDVRFRFVLTGYDKYFK